MFLTRFGRASRFLAFFRGAILDTVRFLGFSLGPSEAFFLGREAERVFCASLALFFFFPVSLCFAAVFFTTHANEAYPQAIAPALRPSEGQGRSIVLGRLDTAFRDPFLAYLCLVEGHRDPSGLFLWGGGAFSALSGPFSHALVPAPGFFFLSSSCWLSGPRMDWQTL